MLKIFWQRLVDLKYHLSLKEKILVLILLGVLLGLVGWQVKKYIYNRLVLVPAYGGTYTEGLIGKPKILSPLSSFEESDQQVLSLLYVGLTHTSADSRTQPVLAESWVISEDGKEYTFTLRDNLKWHDGTPLTTSDVAETIKRVTDPQTKSPYQADWEGVTVEVVDRRTIKFRLEQPSSPFLAATSLPIVPLHIPDNELQGRLIGNGPYKYASSEVEGGAIVQMKLTSFYDWWRGRPFIDNIVFKFYDNQENLETAYQNGEIDAFYKHDRYQLNENNGGEFSGQKFILPTQRRRLLFLNIASDKLKELNARRQLINGAAFNETLNLKLLTHENLADHPGLVEQLDTWNKNNVRVEVTALNSTDLLAKIDAHEYDVLFVDLDMKADLDLYPIWHSSQRGNGGYNFSQIDNEQIDRKLEEARVVTNFDQRQKLTQEVEQQLHDLAVYLDLEQVTISWWVSDKILGIPAMEFVATPQDRYADVDLWRIKTKHRTLKSIYGGKLPTPAD